MPPLSPSPALVAVRAGVAAAMAEEPLTLRPEVLLGNLDAALVARNQLDFLTVRALREAFDARVIDLVEGRSVKSWLTEERGIAPGETGSYLLLMLRLELHRVVHDHFAAGLLTMAQAAAVVKALQWLPDEVRDMLERDLVEMAIGEQPSRVRDFADRLLEALGIDKNSDVARERLLSSRHVKVVDAMDRCGQLSGLLMPETRVKFVTALRRAAVKTGPEDDRTVAQRYHDAFDEIIDVYLASTDEPSMAGSPRSVLVVIPLEVLEDRASKATAQLLPLGARIAPETARRLACDAELIPTVLGSHSEVLDLGRATREFNAPIRRAAYLEQHGKCAFPRCGRPCKELHHIIWWTGDGHTSLDNAAWLCAYHHWLVHEGRWSMRRNTDHSFTFTNPYGEQHTRHLQAA